jgi:long-chain acyl-CoA synthetase
MPYKNIAELLILNANRYPNKTAIIYKDKRISYKELNKKVNQIAQGLKNLGVGFGDKVGYLLPNSNQLIEVYFAIQKIGAVAIPLNYRLIPREIEFLVEAGQCKVLIFAEYFRPKVEQIRPQLFSVEFFICDGQPGQDEVSLEKMAENSSDEEPSLSRNENALSRIQFTGGTTGIPKGVMRTHYNDISEIISVMMSSKMGANPDEIVLIQCPMEHHGGHSWFVSVIGTGATLVICDVFKADDILSLIERERVTYLLLLPPSTHLRLLDSPNFNKYDMSSVRLVQSSAGATSPEIIKRIYEGYPNCQMNYGWGQTESGTGSSIILTLEMAEKGFPEVNSIGKPMPFLEMKIIDENNQEVPVGEVGECVVKGPTTMVGYYNQLELSANMFLEDGWVRTGDMMKKDENGYFYIMSRKKDMIKSGGENVFAEEVANVIRKHPSIKDCVVFGVPDARLGEAVMTVVQLRKGCSLTLEELQSHCKKYLSSYKKPLYIDFIDQFQMDDAGKIPKYKMKNEYRRKFLNKMFV